MHYTTKETYEKISKSMNDPIIEQRTCAVSWVEFPIFASDDLFYNQVSPVIGWIKQSIPRPTLCPEERLRRRAQFRNERKLYKRKCDATGESMVSIYSAEKPYTVYNQKYRWSDAWDPMQYGREYEGGKSFVNQFDSLLKTVPKLWIINDNGVWSVNCEYTCDFVWGKNCYMCFEMWDCEDSLYSHHSNWWVNICDCDEATGCRDCYEVLSSVDCFDSRNLHGCIKATSCMYSDDLLWCDHCLFCCGLQNQSYMFMNNPISKEEYKEVVRKIYEEDGYLDKLLADYKQSVYKKDSTHNIRQSENCNGYNISHSSNLSFCYNSFYSQNIKYWRSLYQVQDSSDVQCWKTQLCYEGQTLDESYWSAFCARCSRSKYIFYSFNCHDCSHIFGCDGLRNKSYCIFNKQYTKEEYEKKVAEIIRDMKANWEWGEFFPISISPFCYNETCAQEYLPMSREDALARWYTWYDISHDPVVPEGAEVVRPAEMDFQSRKDLLSNDDVLKKIVICAESGRPFRIMKQELDFYRKHTIHLPKFHFDVRHLKRIERMK